MNKNDSVYGITCITDRIVNMIDLGQIMINVICYCCCWCCCLHCIHQ